MPGLVPGIHVFSALGQKDVDGRDKPGHDGEYGETSTNIDNCEERSDEAIQLSCRGKAGLLRCARNDCSYQSMSSTIFVISAAEKARSDSVRILPSLARLSVSDMKDDSSGASTMVTMS
jgi:hypothetical protein